MGSDRTPRKAGRPPKPVDTALREKVTVYLTADQKRKLDRLARQDNRSMGEVARQCIGIGWQQLSDARRFFNHDDRWGDGGGE